MKKKKGQKKSTISNIEHAQMHKKASKWLIVAIIILAIILIIEIIVFTSPSIKKTEPQEPREFFNFTIKPQLVNSTSALLFLPAVDNNGSGIITLLVVEAIPGNGRTMVDIDNLFFWADTQNSIKTAKKVASNVTGINTSKFDIVYNIYANASLVGGESAGAAITIATISVIENKAMNKDVMITGTINENGTIGKVQNVLAKAKAVKAINITTFLVPKGEATEQVFSSEKACRKIMSTNVCVENLVQKQVNIANETGINIVEISNITEALPYFFN